MRKNPIRFAFVIIYAGLAIVTTAALATPPAFAAGLLRDQTIAPLVMITSVAILMSVLVIEIWRQTGKNAGPRLQNQLIAARKKRQIRQY